MANSLKRKLIHAIKNNSEEEKNMVLGKLSALSKIYKEYNDDLAATPKTDLEKFENNIVDMAEVIDIHNDIYSLALVNDITKNSMDNTILKPLEPNEKMINCLNVMKYKKMINLMKDMKRYDSNLLSNDGMKDKSMEPSYENFKNNQNDLSVEEAFSNLEHMTILEGPLSPLILMYNVYKGIDDLFVALEKKYIVKNVHRILGIDSGEYHTVIRAINRVDPPLDQDLEGLYLSDLLSDFSTNNDYSYSDTNEGYDDVMSDTVSSALKGLKEVTNDPKLLPFDDEVKIDDNTGEMIESSLVDGANNLKDAMDYVNDVSRELDESQNPIDKEIAKKTNLILKKGMKKLNKQVIKSLGRTSYKNINKALNGMRSLSNAIRAIDSAGKEISSSTLNKLDSIGSVNNRDSSKTKKPKNMNSIKNIRKNIRKNLKKLKFSKKP